MDLHILCSRAILATTIISLALPCAACGPAPTIEEAGGYRIIYALRSAKPLDQQAAVEAVQRRLDAYGLPGSTAAKGGTDQIEITLPGVTAKDLAKLQKLLVTPGKLEFRILAQKGTHDALIDATSAATTSPEIQSKKDQPPGDQGKGDQVTGTSVPVEP